MECEALKRVRNDMGLTNVEIMVPFVRTLGQAERVVEHAGRARPEARQATDGLRVIMMCEVPSNAILAEQFLEHFDGMSIGSNDLTQLTLGLDRDSGLELLARRLRRTRPGGQGADLARHRGLPRARQVRRHLRPGPERPPGLRRLAGRRGHRVDLAEPRHGGRDLAAAGQGLRSAQRPAPCRPAAHHGACPQGTRRFASIIVGFSFAAPGDVALKAPWPSSRDVTTPRGGFHRRNPRGVTCVTTKSCC